MVADGVDVSLGWRDIQGDEFYRSRGGRGGSGLEACPVLFLAISDSLQKGNESSPAACLAARMAGHYNKGQDYQRYQIHLRQ